MEEELWRAIPGWEGSYEASDRGRVRSLDRTITRTDGGHGSVVRRRGRVLRPGRDSDGHLRVVLCANARGRTRKVHRLVLEAFVGPCPDGMECCHNNGDPADNRLSNLRWDTLSSNAYDRIKHGAHNMARRTHCALDHLLVAPNLQTRTDGYRSCRSCVQARGARSKRGETREWFVADAHRRYEALMGSVRVPFGSVTALVATRDATRSDLLWGRDGNGSRAGTERIGERSC